MYKAYTKSVPSPFQVMQTKAFDVEQNNHPANDYILKTLKNLGSFNFTATFEEDRPTLDLFRRNVPGLVALICTLRLNNEIVGQGRGTAVLSKANRFIDKVVHYAVNSSLVDAIVRSTKSLDVLQLDTGNKDDITPILSADEPASEKQRQFLHQLIKYNVTDNEERSRWEERIRNISKDDASEAIQRFKGER